MIALAWRRLALATITVFLAGCGSGSTMQTYVLGDPAPPAIGVSSEDGLPVIELKPVSVPDYLDTSDILSRTGPNQMTPSATGRWGERLSVGLTRALASDLSRRLPLVVIATAETPEPTRRILVDIERFEIAADGQCLLAGRWRITARDGQTTADIERGSFSEAAGSIEDAAVASAMTRAVD
ncbi:MAG TPA: PqiC family protein, partial [Stellaceae bacterium]|nr:PqiC family protein [Stellaceae bacterium]